MYSTHRTRISQAVSIAILLTASSYNVYATDQRDPLDAQTIADLDKETAQNAIAIDQHTDSLIEHDERITNAQTAANNQGTKIENNGKAIETIITNIDKVAVAGVAAKSAADSAKETADKAKTTADAAKDWITENNYIVRQGEVSKERSIGNKVRSVNNENEIKTAKNDIAKNVETLKDNKKRMDYNRQFASDAFDNTMFLNNQIEAHKARTNAVNAYLGVLPPDGQSDTKFTLFKHASQENIHLGVGAQVGDNLNPDDEGYDSVLIKTGMTAVGAYSRADADTSTTIGARSKTYGENSVAIGYQSYAYDANTVSFGNDYVAAIEAVEGVEAVEYQAATEAVEAVEASEGVEAVEAVEAQPEILAVEGVKEVKYQAEIQENNRRLTHVAAGINKNDAVNMEQYSNLSDRVSTNRDEARSGISMAMAMDVLAPSPGKKFRLNLAMAEFEGTNAIGITGAGRVNDNVSLYFGYGVDIDNNYSALKVGTSYEW